MDEARHFFALQLFMRVFGPYMGFTVPFWAAVVQAGLRLLPSCITGLMSNPQPVLFKAVLTNDYSLVPYVVAGTAAGSIASLIAGQAIKVVQARVFPKKTGAAAAGVKAADKPAVARDSTPGPEAKQKTS